MDTLERLVALDARIKARIKIEPAIIVGLTLGSIIVTPALWGHPQRLLLLFAVMVALVAAGYAARAWFRWSFNRAMAREYPREQPQMVQRDDLVYPPAEQRRNASLN